jgi:CHAD domain-containing protein
MLHAPPTADSIVADPWRETLLESLEVAREGQDTEGVHDLRVACARLDVFLRFVGWRALRDDLRWLRRAAAGVRDFDVLLAGELPAAFRAQLEAEREPARRALARVLDDERCTALLDALENTPAATRDQAKRTADALRAKLAKRGERAEAAGGTIHELHALRRALRRLRYAHEWLGHESKTVRKLQDELGALNDAGVALRLLNSVEAHESAAEFRAQLESDIAQRAAAALETWVRARAAILEEHA